MDTIDRAMNTIKDKGFINYYGMVLFILGFILYS